MYNAKTSAARHGIDFEEKIVTSNDTINAIANFAKSDKFEIIVIGARGSGSPRSEFFGSVSNGILYLMVSQRKRGSIFTSFYLNTFEFFIYTFRQGIFMLFTKYFFIINIFPTHLYGNQCYIRMLVSEALLNIITSVT